MNFEIVTLLALAACALAIPVPDEEVSTLKKVTVTDSVTSVDELVKSIQTSTATGSTVSPIAGNVTVENKTENVTELGKPTEKTVESTSPAEDDVKEVPKSLPVVAKESKEAIVPPVSEVRAEPKEGVEIGEAKSVDIVNKTEPAGDIQPSTESSTSETADKKAGEPTATDKSKPDTAEAKPTSPQPPIAGENKPEGTTTPATEQKKNESTSVKPKPTESGKDKHDHNSEESAESKESEESDESNKSK